MGEHAESLDQGAKAMRCDAPTQGFDVGMPRRKKQSESARHCDTGVVRKRTLGVVDTVDRHFARSQCACRGHTNNMCISASRHLSVPEKEFERTRNFCDCRLVAVLREKIQLKILILVGQCFLDPFMSSGRPSDPCSANQAVHE